MLMVGGVVGVWGVGFVNSFPNPLTYPTLHHCSLLPSPYSTQSLPHNETFLSDSVVIGRESWLRVGLGVDEGMMGC